MPSASVLSAAFGGLSKPWPGDPSQGLLWSEDGTHQSGRARHRQGQYCRRCRWDLHRKRFSVCRICRGKLGLRCKRKGSVWSHASQVHKSTPTEDPGQSMHTRAARQLLPKASEACSSETLRSVRWSTPKSKKKACGTFAGYQEVSTRQSIDTSRPTLHSLCHTGALKLAQRRAP